MGFSGGGQVTGMGPNVCLSLKTNSPKSDLNGSFFFWGCVANTNLAPNILTLNPKFGVRSLAGLES